MPSVRSLVEKIIRLQDEIAYYLDRETRERLEREIESEPERTGIIVVVDKGKEEEVAITLRGKRAYIVEDVTRYDHRVTMDIDTFLDLLTGELDLGEAWALGLVKVEGEDPMIHLIRWVKWFRLMRTAVRRLLDLG